MKAHGRSQKERRRKKRENEIKSQLFTDDMFNNIQVPEIKPIVKKRETERRKRTEERFSFRN